MTEQVLICIVAVICFAVGLVFGWVCRGFMVDLDRLGIPEYPPITKGVPSPRGQKPRPKHDTSTMHGDD